MNNFELKKYFGNLVGMPTTMKQSVTKSMLQKGVSDARLVRRSK